MKEGLRLNVTTEKEGENWQFYYLRRKQSAEHNIKRWFHEQGSELSEEVHGVIDHGLFSTKGKRVRPVLTYLVHDLVGGTSPLISILAELPHRGSLLEDDIDDNAVQRDGQNSAHHTFGVEATREACDFLYDAPVKILDSLAIDSRDRQKLVSEYTRLSIRARKGQRKDVQWGNSNTIPTIEEYLQMCEEKCAAFEYAIRIGAHFGGASPEETDTLVSAGNKTATAFQLVDDLISLKEGSDDYGSDITEGKKTVPVIVAAQNENSQTLIDIIASHTTDPELIAHAIHLIDESGGISATQQIASYLVDESNELIKNQFEDSRYRKILFSILEYGLCRNE